MKQTKKNEKCGKIKIYSGWENGEWGAYKTLSNGMHVLTETIRFPCGRHSMNFKI